MRIALGASRRRVVAQLFVEALLLSAAAAVVGLVVATLFLRRLGMAANHLLDGDLPYWIHFTLSSSTVLYVVALTVVSAAVVGVLPALKATTLRTQATLRALGGARGMRMGRTWTILIGVQAEIAVALLPLGAALQIQSVLAWRNVATSDAMRRIISASIELEEPISGGAGSDAEQRALEARFADRRTEILRRLQAEPGVEAASFASDVPSGGTSQRWLEVEGLEPTDPPTRHPANSYEVGPGLFDVFGGHILAGRSFPVEVVTSPTNAAVVSQSFVESALGGGNPLGRRFRYATNRDEAGPGALGPGEWYEVVGVVSNFPTGSAVSMDEDASAYHPLVEGRTSTETTLIVRGRAASTEGMAARVWSTASELDPTLHVSEVRSVAETLRISRTGGARHDRRDAFADFCGSSTLRGRDARAGRLHRGAAPP